MNASAESLASSIVKNFLPLLAASAMALAAIFIPVSAFALEIGPGPGPGGDIEIFPGLAAEHAGSYVEEDVSFDGSEMSFVVGDDLAETTGDWLVQFLMPLPDAVPADRTAFVLGQVDPDFSLHIIGDYDIGHAAIPGDDGDEETIESTTVTFPNLHLKDPTNPSGTYALFTFTYPDTKIVENTDPICQDWDYWDLVDYVGYEETCLLEESYTEQDFLDWVQWNLLIDRFEYEGDIPETYDPEHTRQLFFDYTASTYVEPTEPDPVIVIPGILGSWEKNGGLVIDPVLHTYDDLINTFVLNGFEVGETIFPFPYNWRESNIFTAGLLRNKINEVQAICECDKVDIVAHSMGGLVARYYIQSGLYEDDVDQLVFIATPHLGSPKAYLAWENGEFGFQVRDNVLEFVLRVEGFRNGFTSLFNYIRNHPIPSVQQLLSTGNYLKEASTGDSRIYPESYPTNSFLESLNSNVGTLLSSGVSISNVVGNIGPASTIDTLRVVPSPNLPRWEHGYPENYNDSNTDRGLEYSAGDDTVPLPSASFIDSNLLEVNANHNDIVKTSQALIYKTLVGEDPEQVSDLQQSNDTYLLLQVLSPVDVQIVAPDGKRLGKDFDTGNEFNEIPGAFYSGFGTDNEYAVIPNPQNGEYKVLSQGTDSGGEYTLVTGYASPTGLVQQETSSHILPDEFEESTIVVNNNTPDELTIEDTTPVTYDILLGHIEEAASLGWITNNKFKKLITKTAQNAEKLSHRKRGFGEKALLYALLIELRIGNRKGKINDDGYNLLKEDVQSLIRE